MLLNGDGSLLAAVSRPAGLIDETEIAVWQLGSHRLEQHDPSVVIPLKRDLAPDGAGGCASHGIAAFSPREPDLLAIGGRNGAVSLWDARVGRAVGAPLRSGFDPVLQLAFSADGARLLARNPGGISVWDVLRRRALDIGVAEAAADEGAWFVDPRTVVAVGSTGTIAASDLVGLRNKLALPGTGGEAVDMEFSPDGSALAVEDTEGVIRFLDVRSWRPFSEPISTGFESPTGFVYSGDGKKLIAEGTVIGGEIRQEWDVASRRRIGKSKTGEAGIPAYSADGTPVVIETGLFEVSIKSLGSGALITRLEGTQDAQQVELHPEADQALIETLWGSGIWDTKTGKRIGRLFPSRVAAWTAEGTLVATGGDAIELWDAESGKRLATFPSETGGQDLKFSPDGRLLVAAGDGLELWDVQRRTLVGGRPLGDLGVDKVEFSADGSTVATLGDGVFAWTLDRGEWAAVACRLAGRRLTKTEWEELAGSREFSPAC